MNENKVVVKKKNVFRRFWYIFLILLVCIVCIGSYFLIEEINKKSELKDEPIVINSFLSLPTNTEFKLYGNDAIELKCYFKGTQNQAITLKKGNEIECYFNVELYGTYKIKELYAVFHYGSFLTYSGYKSTNENWNVEIKDNDIKIVPNKVTNSDTQIIIFSFLVNNDSKSENLFVSLENVLFMNYDDQYYKVVDLDNNRESRTFSTNFKIVSAKYYIYSEYDSEDDVDVYESILDAEGFKLLTTYDCSNNYCKYLSSAGNYVLFDDQGLVAYDYKTNKSYRINSDLGAYFEIQLIADTKLKGIVTIFSNEIKYYSFDANKYVLSLNGAKHDSIFEDENHQYLFSMTYNDVTDNSVIKVYDYKGESIKLNSIDLKKVKDSNFYYKEICVYEDYNCYYLFTNSEKKRIFGDRLIDYYYIDNDGNIVIINENGNGYDVYNSNGKLIRESKKYTSVNVLVKGGYVGVVDTDNYLKITDDHDNILATFIKMTERYELYSDLSGWYEENGKEGVYLVVNDEYSYDETEEDKGYEFYYIPKTGESGTIETDGVGAYAKPVLYLYPKNNDTHVNVSFKKPELLTTTYPKYINNWEVLANSNGDLYDKNGNYYYGLYWEERGSIKVDFTKGFYVTKDDAINFLESKLTTLGLNARERNEFIMYWLPILEKNGKSLVYFELTKEREAYNKLIISPKPDSLLRIAIHIKKVNKKVDIVEQKLETFKRTGFTAVEWGGVIHE